MHEKSANPGVRFRIAVLALMLLLPAGCGPAPESELAAEGGPAGETLRRLAVKALRETGVESRKPLVTVDRRLGPGDYLVTVVTDSGRSCGGRLFRDRARYRLTLDPASVHSRELTVRIRQ